MRAKREIALKQLDNEFSDTKNDRLLEQMYSQEDVEALLDDLGRLVRSNVRQEIGAFMGMTSIILKQLLEGAEERGVTTLEINTGKVEDRGASSHILHMCIKPLLQVSLSCASYCLLELCLVTAEMLAEIEKMRADGPSQQRPSTNRLISIKDEHARLIEDKAKAEKEVKTLQV
jgi:Leucine zipper